MQSAHKTNASPSSWLDQPILAKIKINWETTAFALIVLLAIVTRFYLLEPRVMSHDETSHTYFSWLLYKGSGYAHDPITHGPLQFHLVALSYFLFGDSDTSARIPAVLFSIATVWFAWYYRRLLGRFGALAAALLFVISPFFLYYGRYVRNEAFVGLFGVINIWAILRYFETGRPRYLLWLTLATILHFTAKETSYIYTAQSLLFLGIYFLERLAVRTWPRRTDRQIFFAALLVGIALFGLGLWTHARTAEAVALPETPRVAEGAPRLETAPLARARAPLSTLLILAGVASIAGGLGFMVYSIGMENLRKERSFDMLILLGTLVLPLLSAFLLNFLGWKVPINMTEVNALTFDQILRMALVVIPLFGISAAIGIWWNPRQWLINAGIFWGIFTVFYTTLFTNGAGFTTGLVGSLGYWLAQQEVNRGSQPPYYYLLVQIPVYEYLPALGTLGAFIYAWMRPHTTKTLAPSAAALQMEASLHQTPDASENLQTPPVFSLLAFWSLTSALAFTIAGEKMPWLTFHIALPLILTTAWFIGWLVETTDWKEIIQKRGLLALLLGLVFLLSLTASLGSVLGNNPPFQGKSLEQLSATTTFVISFLVTAASGAGLAVLLKEWSSGQITRFYLLVIFGLLAILTTRTAFMASYINYDNATEYLVYAHCGPGIKIALNQIEEISKRTTGALDVVVAYDNDTTYPYWWYLRNYKNQKYYGANPTRELRDAPLILVGDSNYGKIEPVVQQGYYRFEYIRIWWPNQDYYNLTPERIWNTLKDPQMRAAVFKIWLYRDYSDYARLTNRDFSLSNWSPSAKMRLYIRKDILNMLWDYGSAPTAEPVVTDPYEGKQISLLPDRVIGQQGSAPGQFLKPRNLAVASDGSLYVADTENHRIQHLTPDGDVLQVWGSFADISKGPAPGGTFFEPWGIAVAPDGSVFVADTWNHRIQKFTAEGNFITMWGTFGQAETPTSFWGPRGLAIDGENRLLVTDTGNKRVVIFDLDGNYLTQFGSAGLLPGQFDEPVGIAVSQGGVVYITDTWNQRIQAFTPDGRGSYLPLMNWEVAGWFGQSLDNKPYIAVDSSDRLFVTDPEGYRVLEFSGTGAFHRYWGIFSLGTDGFNLPVGIAFDHVQGVWVADSGNHRLLHFTVPAE